MNQIPNIKQYTVTELNSSIKKIIEGSLFRIKVKGEVSQLTRHSSGHIYCTLKDNTETISAVCWRTKVANLSFIPKEGESIILEGKVTTYSPQSKYQVIIESIEYEGEGSLLKTLEEIKKRLLKEGLFDSKNKKKIPYLPSKIGVITSETGAVIRDIIHRIKDRFPVELILFPVNVQGNLAVIQIIDAIELANIQKNQGNKHFDLDLLIIARGGGSLEDLMPFNNEQLVHSIYKSKIPIISAVGHETDITLCDFVADLRVPTPTAAAEYSVPVKKELLDKLFEKERNLIQSINHKIEKKYLLIEKTYKRFPDLDSLIQQKFQLLDNVDSKLNNFLKNFVNDVKIKFKNILNSFQPKNFLNELKYFEEKNYNIFSKLDVSIRSRFNLLSSVVEEKGNLLESLSYKKVLKRGYSVTRVNKRIVFDDKDIPMNEKVEIEFYQSKTITKKIKS
ncbi:MAG: exodeoxyribonuclease VII large subunit [Rickettsiales bacterium]|nr:exodeoxyribonuclease VII large subunit [Rickettsiales bacterium]